MSNSDLYAFKFIVVVFIVFSVIEFILWKVTYVNWYLWALGLTMGIVVAMHLLFYYRRENYNAFQKCWIEYHRDAPLNREDSLILRYLENNHNYLNEYEIVEMTILCTYAWRSNGAPKSFIDALDNLYPHADKQLLDYIYWSSRLIISPWSPKRGNLIQ